MNVGERGTTLVVGLVLLALVTLLGLAGAATAHIESELAHNEQFRENAASAASAGIELAISRIVTHSEPATFSATFPGLASRCEVRVRFMGFDSALPQEPGANVSGAHFEIVSTGFSSRRAVDRQRAIVMRVQPDVGPATLAASECSPAVTGVHCYRANELARLSWQQLPAS